MRKLIYIAGMALFMLFACSPKPKQPADKPVQTILKDSVLENPAMDSISASQRRGHRPPAGPVPPVIYLDFDGHYLTNTLWNTNGPLTLATSGLNSPTRKKVVDSVQAHYAQFGIEVTQDQNRYNAAPSYKKQWVIITDTWDWYAQVAGVAYVNSFSWFENNPCFVFSSLLNDDPVMIAYTAIHESGHTLGLRHQSLYDTACIKLNEYNPGSDGVTPHMGLVYPPNRGSWWVGYNTLGCTVIQNDTSIIKSKL